MVFIKAIIMLIKKFVFHHYYVNTLEIVVRVNNKLRKLI